MGGWRFSRGSVCLEACGLRTSHDLVTIAGGIPQKELVVEYPWHSGSILAWSLGTLCFFEHIHACKLSTISMYDQNLLDKRKKQSDKQNIHVNRQRSSLQIVYGHLPLRASLVCFIHRLLYVLCHTCIVRPAQQPGPASLSD